MTDNYSVLMSVYYKADPRFLIESIDSMLRQTAGTNDFVIVCDGQLTQELDDILAKYDQSFPGLFNIIRLEKNVGIGQAANIGIHECKNELVAKMDADDISVEDRCEHQLECFRKNPELALLGGYIDEFDEDPKKPFSVRSVPLKYEDILRYTKRRQSFNNMTVMYRRSAVIAVGGYRDFRRAEDYDLYLRLLHAGYYAENLPECLVKARVNNGAFARRASMDTLKGCVRSRWYAHSIGFSSLMDFLICVLGEVLIIISPPKFQQFLYLHFLREKVGSRRKMPETEISAEKQS